MLSSLVIVIAGVYLGRLADIVVLLVPLERGAGDNNVVESKLYILNTSVYM